MECIHTRLIHDDEIFDDEVRELADLIIDTSNSNVYDDAKKYMNFIRSIYKYEEENRIKIDILEKIK